MDQDIRWTERLNSFKQSLEILQEVYARRATRPLDRVELQALIKSFELCYETGWNLMKDWLEYQGATGISGARDAIRSAVSYGLIPAGSSWMDMLLTRNRTIGKAIVAVEPSGGRTAPTASSAPADRCRVASRTRGN